MFAIMGFRTTLHRPQPSVARVNVLEIFTFNEFIYDDNSKLLLDF